MSVLQKFFFGVIAALVVLAVTPAPEAGAADFFGAVNAAPK